MSISRDRITKCKIISRMKIESCTFSTRIVLAFPGKIRERGSVHSNDISRRRKFAKRIEA